MNLKIDAPIWSGVFMYGIMYFVFVIALLVICIYCMMLFIKLARRGIKALDIYIDRNK